MLVDGKNYRAIWPSEKDPSVICIIDQRKLPFEFVVSELRSVEDVWNAISSLAVRGAPLIGAAGAFGVYLASLEASGMKYPMKRIEEAALYLKNCRPTAVNLSWAINMSLDALRKAPSSADLSKIAFTSAMEVCENEIARNIEIGKMGLPLIQELSRRKGGKPVNILTHCNAGWLACVDYGTATAPIYLAHEKGIPVHVWVDETRPRNQGSRLTAWELGKAGVPYSIVCDNSGGHLMQHGLVDIVLVGSDRTTRRGDVANKIGTYLKALAAEKNKIPFYAVLPSSTFDFSISDGVKEIAIEERDPSEVEYVEGMADNKIISVRTCPDNAKCVNFAFDVTPAELITGLITERGICGATEENIKLLFADKFM